MTPWQRLLLIWTGLVAFLWAPAVSAQCPDGSAPPCRPSPVHLSDSLVAILPFRAVGSSLAVFGEGLVYLLSANLDGAGGLTTVQPQRAITQAAGRPIGDPAEATALARGLGAGIVVTGSLVPTGGGRVRLLMSALEVRSPEHHSLVSLSFDGSEGDVGALADSASLLLISRLSAVPLTQIVLASRLPRSIDALRAFLAAERAFVIERFDQADTLYQRALTFDSTFALAEYRRFMLRRISAVLRPPSIAELSARALALSDRLPERERRLLHASRRGGTYLDSTDLVERMDLVTRYPDDAEGWYWLEDWYFHAGAAYGYPLRAVVEAGERAIDDHTALSAVYVHAIWAAGRAGDSATVERVLGAARRLPGQWLQIARLVARLRWMKPDSARRVIATLRDASPGELASIALQLSVIDPRIETLDIVEAILERVPQQPGWRAEILAASGRFSEALAVLDSAHETEPTDTNALLTRAVIALAGLSGRQADTTIGSALRSALAMWGANAYVPLDLVVLLHPDSSTEAERARWLLRHPPVTETDSALVALDSLRIFGRLALARGDTVTALRLLEPATRVAIDASPFPWGRLDALDQYLLATVFVARGEGARARALLDRPDRGYAIGGGILGLKLLLLADLEAAAADTTRARQHYADVVALWQGGDAAVQPYVVRARTALARLEPR